MKENEKALIDKFLYGHVRPSWRRNEATYEDSWDRLIPVVHKISEYRLAHPDEADKVCNCKVVIGIRYLYPKVVEFIKYLNAHP